MRLPPIFRPFCRYWRLSEGEARQFWSALVRSHTPPSRQWRQQMLLFGSTHLGTTGDFIDQVSTPPVVMAVLEALIEEGTLRAEVGRAIEERILRRTDASGAWKGPPLGSQAAVSTEGIAIPR